MFLIPNQGKILVVDDFELNRDMLARRLSNKGFCVETAGDGYAAIEAISKGNFDLVLLDIMMPGLDGFQVLRRIREHYTSADLSVVMVTAKDQSEDIVKAINEGADDYVTKPIDFQVVMARIKSQLSRREAELRLRLSEERYSLAARGANDGLWDWDLKTGNIFFSERWKTMLGLDAKAEIDNPEDWFSRVHPEDRDRVEKEIHLHLGGEKGKFESEHRMRLRDDSYRWMLARGSAVFDENGVAYRMVGWQTDIHDHGEHDFLTGLPNRALFLDRLSMAVARCIRKDHYHFAVISLGLDRFRFVNESLGHVKGDILLQEISSRLHEALRPGDTLARLGGDEFTFLLDDVGGMANSRTIAERLRKALEDPFQLEDQEVHMTASLGIVIGGKDHHPEELLRMAHKAMFQAKSQGKNCCEIYDPNMNDRLFSVLHLENRMRKGLQNNEFFLLYQPQVDLKSGDIIGAEALVRWQKKGGDLISPAQFIPTAEETGLIIPIGELVIETACRQNIAWQEMGLPKIRIGVNLSGRQFKHGNLLKVVRDTLESSQLDPKYLDLELTESLLMENVEKTIQDLHALKKLGIQISVDDFGTGYSSLSYLKKFPIDTLKVDQSFVRDVTVDPDDAAITTAVVRLAQSLRMRVIAEGVETKEHLEILRGLGCDEIQGYYFSRPVPAEELTEMLKNKRNLKDLD